MISTSKTHFYKLKYTNALHICLYRCVYTCTYKDAHCNILLIAKIREIICMYTNKGFAKLQYRHKMKYYAAFKTIHYRYLYLSRTSSPFPLPPRIHSQQLLSILLMLGKL